MDQAIWDLISRRIDSKKNHQGEACLIHIGNRINGGYYESGSITILISNCCGEVTIGNYTVHCFPGNIFLMKQGCRFELHKEKGDAVLVNYRKKLFDVLFLSQISDCPLFYDFFCLKDGTDEFLYFDCRQEQPIMHQTEAFLLELSQTDDKSSKMARCITVYFLTNLHRIHQEHLVVTESSMMTEYPIGRVIKYMADHYSQVTLSSVAEHFNYNPAYFSVWFKKNASCTFSRKLREIRLEQSKRLLLTTDWTVEQICMELGFHEKSYYYRCFKQEFGMTPKQYRLLDNNKKKYM